VALSIVLADAVTEHGKTGDRLVRVSLTLPGDRREVRPAAQEFCRQLGASEASLLLTDLRRTNGTEHAYGVTLTQRTNAELIAAWCGIAGGGPKAQRAGQVTGWRRFAETGDERLLREHLGRVVDYMAKPWPPGMGERTTADVYGSGLLATAWRIFREAPAPTPPPTAADARAGRGAVTPSIPGQGRCAVCGAALVAMRADAVTCSGRHRVALCRRRRRAGGPS